VNKVIESPILQVSALTVLSFPLLSLNKKKSAENKLEMMMINTNTTAILIHMTLSKIFNAPLCGWINKNAI
jgi:hypothetical protein